MSALPSRRSPAGEVTATVAGADQRPPGQRDHAVEDDDDQQRAEEEVRRHPSQGCERDCLGGVQLGQHPANGALVDPGHQKRRQEGRHELRAQEEGGRGEGTSGAAVDEYGERQCPHPPGQLGECVGGQ